MIYHPEDAPKKTNVDDHKIENGEKTPVAVDQPPNPGTHPILRNNPQQPPANGQQTKQVTAAQHSITHKL